jgi:NCS1 family nucleobase:cation symporter-1
MSDTTETILIEADKSAWQLLPSERTWGGWKLGISLATAAAATWCYIIGEYVGYYLGFREGFAALFAGSMIGMLIVALAAVPVAMRFGVDSIASSKPQFGSRGWVIPAAMQFVSIVGWNSLLLIFFAKSTTQLLRALGVIGEESGGMLVSATVLLASGLVFLFLLKGSAGVDRVAKILVAHVFIGMWMLYILMTQRWDDLSAAVPAYASTDPLWNYTTGVEIGIVSLLSWWPYIGAMVRMAPNGRTAALPIMVGMGAPVPILSAIGIAGILVLQVSDPSEWMRSVGGPTYGIIALIFVGMAAGVGTYLYLLNPIRCLEHALWCCKRGLNSRPLPYQGSALPLSYCSAGRCGRVASARSGGRVKRKAGGAQDASGKDLWHLGDRCRRSLPLPAARHAV